ncbi:MAG: 4Fe-4S binding protein [Candidatus Omnitrophica bacterium]|nr:4Fe-4S binding protein [Candidatus Omnitrophota bacterium]MBU4345709.1 4Fe-4S binding protein [Candidatus Omnitrophota bacterium]MBU4473162.1 4Fe-4S binding protein [Candidatus Omnitrophota bacterium]MCG2706449.1 4Fe-4S binding protein [Candidatus Omnitrophota bacterium]
MFGPLNVKPGTSRNNKTGSWRTELRPKFLQKDCIACKMCALTCPEDCIEGAQKNTFYCDYEFCKGCGLCAFICPKADITMIEEELKE